MICTARLRSLSPLRSVWGLAAAVLALTAGSAHAGIIVSVNLSGAPSQSFVADTLTLNPGSIPSLNLPYGVPVTTNTQTLSFFVGDSGPTSHVFPFTFTQNVTINGVTHSITQSGTLDIEPAADTLTLFPGPTTAFDLGALGTVFFTPQGTGPIVNGNIGTTTTVQLQGTFLATPEPASIALLGLGCVVLAGRCRLQRRAA